MGHAPKPPNAPIKPLLDEAAAEATVRGSVSGDVPETNDFGERMPTPSTKTYQARPGQVEQRWHLVDAQDKVLGRLAVQLATILTGKHRPTYTPHVDTGDYVVVLNAAQVKLTGSKANTKTHQRYSGYPGGQKTVNIQYILKTHPDRVILRAVRGMMPKNRLARKMLKKLKIYPGAEHPHQAQNPEPLELSC